MVSYNFKTREIFTWDKGNQLIYPIKYNDIGYEKEEKVVNQVGFKIIYNCSCTRKSLQLNKKI